MTCFMCSLTLFFFNDTATTEIYTLSLHDALPIWLGAYTVTLLWNFYSLTPWIGGVAAAALTVVVALVVAYPCSRFQVVGDRKSTRLNSSHGYISYAVFCLKKKKRRYGHCIDEEKS